MRKETNMRNAKAVKLGAMAVAVAVLATVAFFLFRA